MEKKYKIGEFVKIPAEYQEEIEERNDEIVAMRIQIEILSISAQKKTDDFWRFLSNIFPGLENYIVAYQREKNSLLIKKEYEDSEKIKIY